MTKVTKVTVENVNIPGQTQQVDAMKYEAMKNALLEVLPTAQPGLTAKEIHEQLLPLLPQDIWPNGEKAGWWYKLVQLDLEAKGMVFRDEKSKPMRWWQTE